MASLSQDIKRLIGQHFVFGFHGQELSEDVKILVRDFYVGSIILMKRNVGDARQVWSMVRELQLLAKESGHIKPLLIGIDQENGLVSAFSSTVTDAVGTQFPGAMALSATGSPDLAEKVSAASAKELKLCGINWAYSPVADVNTDPRNPVIGVRSFGDDPVEVREYAEAVSRGLTSSGIASSAKHAPGHGNTNVDSHLALPRILKTKAELREIELIPFQGLINAGIPTIMTGHMALPLLTDSNDSDDTPSSLSRSITTDLIRGEMGFKGVIVTDCLEMEAVAQLYGGSEGAGVLSLQAGADIAMICHTMERQRGAVEKTYDAVASGLISVEWLRESGDRIDALKDTFVGTWEDVLDGDFEVQKWTALKQQNVKLSKDAYAASTALICDPLHVLPIKGGPSLVFTPVVNSMNRAVDDSDGVLLTEAGTVRNTAGSSFLSLFASISRRTDPQSQHVVYSALDGDGGELPQDVKESLSTASSIIFATRHDSRSIWQIDYLRKVVHHLGTLDRDATPVPVVVLASCAPYDLLDVKDLQVAYISSFEFTPPALEEATAVIFGEREAKGRVPVLKGRVVGSQ